MRGRSPGTWLDEHAVAVSAALLLLAGATLLAFALRTPLSVAGPDGALYESLGWAAAQAPGVFDCGNLAHAFWAPGWVATIALLYKAIGRDPLAIRVMLVVLALVTAALVGAIATRVAGRRAGVLALLFFLCARLTALYTTFFQYEVAQALGIVLVGALLFLRRARPATPVGLDLAAGAVLAASALLSGRALVLVPLVALALCHHDGGRRAASRLLVVILGMATVLGPWVVRNRHCEGAWILATTNGGYNLWLGNNPRATGGYYTPRPGDLPPHAPHASAAWTREALAHMASHPVQTAQRSLVKAARFWIPLYADQAVLLAAAAAGLWRLARKGPRRRDGLLVWIVGVPLALMLVQSLFFVQARFFVAAQPWVAILAGAGLAGWRPAEPGVTPSRQARARG